MWRAHSSGSFTTGYCIMSGEWSQRRVALVLFILPKQVTVLNQDPQSHNSCDQLVDRTTEARSNTSGHFRFDREQESLDLNASSIYLFDTHSLSDAASWFDFVC